MNLGLNKKKKQNRLYITFRDNIEEKELFDWCVDQSKVGGVANFFKLLALKEKQIREGK